MWQQLGLCGALHRVIISITTICCQHPTTLTNQQWQSSMAILLHWCGRFRCETHPTRCCNDLHLQCNNRPNIIQVSNGCLDTACMDLTSASVTSFCLNNVKRDFTADFTTPCHFYTSFRNHWNHTHCTQCMVLPPQTHATWPTKPGDQVS